MIHVKHNYNAGAGEPHPPALRAVRGGRLGAADENRSEDQTIAAPARVGRSEVGILL